MFVRKASIWLVASVISATFVAGCGGEQSGQSEQGNQGGEEGKPVTSGNSSTDAQSVTGVVKSVETSDRRLKVKPQGESVEVFKYNPEGVRVELDGDEASPQEIAEGQRIELEYFVKDERNIARSISLKPGGAQ